MLDTHQLPALNATLNGLTTVLLTAGYVLIRGRRRRAHRAVMLAAAATSTLFLVSYLVYHLRVGSVGFQSQGWIRPAYFTILLTHSVLAAAIVPLVLLTFWRALRGEFSRHRRVARWTWPLWMYVSITGVVIYFMLYHLDPRLSGAR